MRNRSSAQQLLTFLHTVYDSFQSKSQTDVIYLDFSKAFDSVSHKELLAKLWCFGFRGKIWCWLKAYLSHRLKCVSINGKRSGLLPVISGVLQGSILGPLLFLIFINDLPDSTHSSSLLLYADDAKCFRPIASSTDHHLLQDDLNSLFNWSLKWRLCFNTSKCALLRLTSGYSSSQSPPYYINDEEIDLKVCHRDLGILISGNLSWTNHYDHTCSCAYQMLGLLRRVFSATDELLFYNLEAKPD